MAPSTMREDTRDQTGNRRPWQVAAEQLSHTASGLDWLTERRTAALVRADRLGLPDQSQEEWRYTSLTPFARRWLDHLAGARLPAVPEPVPPTLAGVFSVDIVDGMLCAPLLATPPGLTIQSLQNLGAEWRTRVEALLGSAVSPTDTSASDSLIDLNTALLTDLILVTTEPGASVAIPIHMRLQATAASALCQTRLLVDLAAGSRLTLSLEFTGTAGVLVNAVSQMCLGRDSELNLVRVQALPDDGMLLESTSIEANDSAAVTVTSVDLGGQLSRQSLTVRLAGTGASATVHGLFLADGQRHIDNRTRLQHEAPSTTSREFFRGIAADHGHGVFSGKIIVQPGAAGSNAALTNRNLLLTTTAEIDTKPELEIYVDDVRCSHGATTGQLDANALFYLQSRGLDLSTARQVLTAAFLRDSLTGIPLPELRERLEARLESRLQAQTGAAR